MAVGQTHVREPTGRNDGVEVRKYLKILHLPEGTPYCGAFIEWVYQQCGISSNMQAHSVAYSWMKYPQWVVWNKGSIRDKKAPQSGDVAVFTWRQRTGGVRHHSKLVAEWMDSNLRPYFNLSARFLSVLGVEISESCCSLSRSIFISLLTFFLTTLA